MTACGTPATAPRAHKALRAAAAALTVLIVVPTCAVGGTAYAYGPGDTAAEDGSLTETTEAASAQSTERERAAEKLAAADGRLYIKDGKLRMDAVSGETFLETLERAVNSAYRACSAGDLGRYYYGEGYCFESVNGLDILPELHEYADDWGRETAGTIIPDGTSKDDAIYAAYAYVTGSFSYDTEALLDETLKREETAKYAIENKKAICGNFALLFRSLLEAVPFDGQGAADWEAEDPSRISVALVYTPGEHTWNAINENGTWYMYDCSQKEGCGLYGATTEEAVSSHPELYGDDTSDWRWLY